MTSPLLLGLDRTDVRTIADALDATVELQPAIADRSTDWRWATALDSWRDLAGRGPSTTRIVIALLAEVHDPTPLELLDLAGWIERCELDLARWVAAFGVAQRRCADHGTIVAIVDRAAPLDAAGRCAETAVSDAVEAMVRSLARSEGPRGVRVNLVTTPARLTSLPVVDPQPPLSAFPGSIEEEVLSTCRMLLSEEAAGLTSTVLHVDSGRSWR
jgi:NAD(P)-dependent dehydrogenase (short-subunit alcohol dehydrogenase family)